MSQLVADDPKTEPVTIWVKNISRVLVNLAQCFSRTLSLPRRVEPILPSRPPESSLSRAPRRRTQCVNEQIRLFFHSIRGPLNNILLGVSLLEEVVGNSPETMEILNNVKFSSIFASDTLDKYAGLKPLISTSQSEEPEQLTMYPFNLHGFFQQIEYLVFFACAEKKIKYVWDIPDEICRWVVGDEHNLTHVVVSILEESIQAAARGSTITLQVMAELTQGDEELIVITLRDTNPPRPSLAQQAGWAMNTMIVTAHGGTLDHTWSENVRYSGSKTRLDMNRISQFINHVQWMSSRVGPPPRDTEPPEVSNTYVLKIPFKLCKQEHVSIKLSGSAKPLSSESGSPRIAPSTCMDHVNVDSLHRIEMLKAISVRVKDRVSPQTSPHQGVSTNDLPGVVIHTPIQQSLHSNEIRPPEPKNCKLDTYTICVVDDSEMARKMLIQVINVSAKTLNIKTDIYQANDGLDAILKFYKEIARISIIFVDNIMPTLAGPNAARLLRALGYQNLMIGITGNSMEDDIRHFYDAGIDFLFTKPFKRTQLDAVWKLVERDGLRSRPLHKLVYENGNLVWKPTKTSETLCRGTYLGCLPTTMDADTSEIPPRALGGGT